jgi:predicted nucleic acid-binding protein
MTVFVDAAVFMYAGGADHQLRTPAQHVLRAVADGRVDAVTSVEVIQEIVHRLVAIRRPELAVSMARDAMDLFAPVLPVTHFVMRRVPELIEQFPGLSARDLVHAATCLQEGLTQIVSPDRGFDRLDVIGLRRRSIDDPELIPPV